MAAATVMALVTVSACKGTTKVENKSAAPAAAPAAPKDAGPGVEVRTNNDTIKVDSTGVDAKIKPRN